MKKNILKISIIFILMVGILLANDTLADRDLDAEGITPLDVSLYANPMIISSGESSIIGWSVSGVGELTCGASGGSLGWSSNKITSYNVYHWSGNFDTGILTNPTTYTYTMTCSDQNHTDYPDSLPRVSKSVTITVSNPTTNTNDNLFVQTDPATNVTYTTATLNGKGGIIYPPGSTSYSGRITAYFRYSKADISPIFCNDIYGTNMISTGDIFLNLGISSEVTPESFSKDITNLTPDTKYYYCAIISNRENIAYGGSSIVKDFRTSPYKTTIKTNSATSIGSDSAVLNGTFNSIEKVTTYFQYKKVTTDGTPVDWSTELGKEDHFVEEGKNNVYGNISFTLSKLDPKTKYQFRVVAITTSGTESRIIYGSPLSFTTIPIPPTTIKTRSATSITSNSAVLNGTYSSTKTASTYFEYREAVNSNDWIKLEEEIHNLDLEAGKTSIGGNVSFALSGLIPSTNYEFRAVIKNNSGEIFYGNVLSFKTRAVPITACPPSQIMSPLTGTCVPQSVCVPPQIYSFPSNSCIGGSDYLFPTVDVTATPASLLSADFSRTGGDSSTISWTSTNATSCSYDKGNGIVKAGTSGSFTTGALTKSKSYSVTCTGAQGTGSGYAYVYVYDDGGSGNENGYIPQCSDTKDNDGDGKIDTLDPNCHVGGVLTGDYVPNWYSETSSASLTGCPNGEINYPACTIYGPGCVNGATNPPACTTGPSVCSNGATNYPTCTIRCLNGATNPLACTANPVYCTNGATNYPVCTIGPNGPCLNGASNPPTCTVGPTRCTNGATNYPACTVVCLNGATNPPACTTGAGPTSDHETLIDGTTGTWDTNDGGHNGTWGTGTDSGSWTATLGTGGTGTAHWAGNGDGTGTWVSGTGSGTWTNGTGTGSTGTGTWANLVLGQTATPPNDAIVRYHEGIETVFIRQIIKNQIYQKKYGYKAGNDLLTFAQNLADQFAKALGYISENGEEIRVVPPDVAAYQLQLSGDKLTVYEYYKNKIVDIRNTTTVFKNASGYEYYFQKN
jgi:hypothetical protein